jgi:hypothetical protein
MPPLSELLGRTFESGHTRARVVEVPINSSHGYVMVESIGNQLRWPVTVALVKQLLERQSATDSSPARRVEAPRRGGGTRCAGNRFNGRCDSRGPKAFRRGRLSEAPPEPC